MSSSPFLNISKARFSSRTTVSADSSKLFDSYVGAALLAPIVLAAPHVMDWPFLMSFSWMMYGPGAGQQLEVVVLKICVPVQRLQNMRREDRHAGEISKFLQFNSFACTRTMYLLSATGRSSFVEGQRLHRVFESLVDA